MATKNKKCKYIYIIKDNPSSRSSQYAQFVSGSQYEFALVDLQTGNGQIYDGITPGTKTVWEAKAYLEQQALNLRSTYRNTGGTTTTNRIVRQANNSVFLADKCGFNFKYASNSKVFKNFVKQDLTGFPKINVLYRPLPGLENINE